MKPGISRFIVVLSTAVLLCTLVLSNPAQAGVTTIRVSVDTGGGDPNGSSSDPFINATGRFVAFASEASDLVVGDDNAFQDIFLRDGVEATTVRVSVDSGGGSPDGASTAPALSGNGRFVAFLSFASDLVAGDEPGADTFVRDTVSGTTALVGAGSPADSLDDEEYGPSISAGGRHVAFVSSQALLPEDTNGLLDVYVRDLVTHGLTRASVAADGGNGDADSISPSLSGTGRFVAFLSSASNLVANDGNGLDDLFVRDLRNGVTVRASVAANGGDPNEATLIRPSMSADGAHVAFGSFASNLVVGDNNNANDVFIRHLLTQTTTRVSVDVTGGDGNGWSTSVSASRDGRYVAFRSTSSDLVPGDDNGFADVFRRDLATSTTTRVSIATDGNDPNNNAWNPSITHAGNLVAFVSFASNLVTDDTNNLRDVFVRSLG